MNTSTRTPLPDTPQCEARATSPGLAALLAQAGEHRLHPALVLVAVHRLPATTVLELRWTDLDLAAHRVGRTSGAHQLGAGTSALLHWHGCRQRLDRLNAGSEWPTGLRVFVDELGHPYTQTRADEAVADLARAAGIAPLTFGALRHPCLTR